MTFKPGVSGNPSGRPKSSAVIRDYAIKFGTEAVDRLVYWMRSDDPRASVTATSLLLDRGFGKAIQQNEHSGIDGAPLMPSLSVTLTNQQLPAPVVKTIDGNSERG